jgi:uncharacterized protein (TIGR03437 family)
MTRFALSSFAFIALAGSLAAQTGRYTITTIAGIGTAGFTGDGAEATLAQFDTPYAVARDSSGNLYIADQANNRIRKIDASGIITTLAGDGTEFFLGNGGDAIKASLINPLGVAVSPAGVLYIADSRNHAIRKIDSAGKIQAVTGNGNPGFGGDMDTDATTDDGDALLAGVNRPIGMAFDAAGNLYFTDQLNQRIRKIDTAGKITTIAGNGEAAYFGDGGLATAAKLNYPQGIAIDSGGNIFFAEGQGHIIRKISPDGTIKTVAGNRTPGFGGDGGKALDASLFYPRGIAVDASGNLYIADTLNSRIRRVAEDGTITTIAGTGAFGDFGDGGPAEQADLFFPTGVTVGPNNTLYVVDTQNHRIKLLTPRTATPTVAPTIDAGGVISASAFGAFKQAAPGSWVEIYGANFANAATEWTASDFVNGRAPVSLAGVSVTIGGQPAPIAYVGPRQINVQVPTGLGLGPQQVLVKTAAGTATSILTVNSTQPGLLAVPMTAKAGETITLYGVGFGTVTPDIAAGQIPGRQTALAQPVKFYFGQIEAQVSYAGLAPNSVGLYQFNVVVPNTGTASSSKLTFTLGGQLSSQSLSVANGN